MGNASAIAGPILVGTTAAVTGDSRTSILSILLLFLGGGALLIVAARSERRAGISSR
jgi:MFS transporter, UMF1 family